MDDTSIKRLSFMAILTLAMLACVQVVSVIALYRGDISIQEYLSVWTPLLTLALGYWFGRDGGPQ